MLACSPLATFVRSFSMPCIGQLNLEQETRWDRGCPSQGWCHVLDTHQLVSKERGKGWLGHLPRKGRASLTMQSTLKNRSFISLQTKIWPVSAQGSIRANFTGKNTPLFESVVVWDNSTTEAWAWMLGISTWMLQFIENFLSVSLQPYKPLLEESSEVKVKWEKVNQVRVSAFHMVLWSFHEIICCCAAALRIYPQHQTKSPVGVIKVWSPTLCIKRMQHCVCCQIRCPYTGLWLKEMLVRSVWCLNGFHAGWKGLVKNLKNQKWGLASHLRVVRGSKQAL